MFHDQKSPKRSLCSSQRSQRISSETCQTHWEDAKQNKQTPSHPLNLIKPITSPPFTRPKMSTTNAKAKLEAQQARLKELQEERLAVKKANGKEIRREEKKEGLNADVDALPRFKQYVDEQRLQGTHDDKDKEGYERNRVWDSEPKRVWNTEKKAWEKV